MIYLIDLQHPKGTLIYLLGLDQITQEDRKDMKPCSVTLLASENNWKVIDLNAGTRYPTFYSA